jgi:hypothetical protein
MGFSPQNNIYFHTDMPSPVSLDSGLYSYLSKSKNNVHFKNFGTSPYAMNGIKIDVFSQSA